MCFGGGKTASSAPAKTVVDYTDPTTGEVSSYFVEDGVPGKYAARGASTVTQYQQLAAEDLSDKQIAADKEIADQQNSLNEKQYQSLQDQYAKEQKQTDEQASRQSYYDSGRSDLLDTGTKAINDAFSSFGDNYFNQYAKDYMSKADDEINYQKNIATKDLGFALARQGITSSQAGINEAGLIEEKAGRTRADQVDASQNAAASLRSSVASSKQDLLDQVSAAESIGSPIAGSTIEDVNSQLQTQKTAVSGVTSTAGDTTSSLKAVPTVNSLGSLFSGVLGAAGSALGGSIASTSGAFNRGLSGTNPSGNSGKG